jgi:hypothetical protein
MATINQAAELALYDKRTDRAGHDSTPESRQRQIVAFANWQIGTITGFLYRK